MAPGSTQDAPPRFRRWLICYVLLGLVQSGMVPIILPLAARPGAAAGLTYAAFAAAGIAAPFIGAWSDRHRRHRLTLAAGLTVAGLALLAYALPGDLAQHMVIAALVGLGVSSASTVGTMFIVEVEPEAHWDGLIGTLQACISGGQLIGLIVAGVLGLRHVGDAFLLGAGLLLLAVLPALAFAPDPVTKVERHDVPPRPARAGDGVPIGPQRSFHRVTWRALAGLSHSGLAWFIAAWLMSYTATNGLSVMFSVAMVRGYHVPATFPTLAYAAGVGCSLLMYPLAARWDTRFGAWRVLSAGLVGRALVVLGIALLATVHTGWAVFLVLGAFGVTQVIWPLLSVASNTLAVTLSPAHRAESVGLLNAATSVGATVGGLLGGILLGAGFVWLCVAVLAALLVSVLASWLPRARLLRAEAGQ